MTASRSIPVIFTMNRCHEWACAYGTGSGRSIPGTPESPARYRRASSARRAFSAGELAHLHDADRGVEVGQVVLVPRLPDVVVRGAPLSVPLPRVPLDPVEPEQPKARGEGVVVQVTIPPSAVVMFLIG